MRLDEIARELTEVCERTGRYPDVFYISNVEALKSDLLHDMESQHRERFLGYKNDAELIAKNLFVCGVPIKIADVVQ